LLLLLAFFLSFSHQLRPYIRVKDIPSFTPQNLPFWETYVREKNESVVIGGTMAGENYAGFSGGQRKLLLFELIYQRTLTSKDLLICLDEPFAGVTDDFVPFILERLKIMSKTHNLLLVTNDHVKQVNLTLILDSPPFPSLLHPVHPRSLSLSLSLSLSAYSS
jgi:ABC-type multidrug transport system ATPase subunit